MAFIRCKNVSAESNLKQFLMRGTTTSGNPATVNCLLECENRNHLSVGNVTIYKGTASIHGVDSTGYFTELFSLSASGNTGESRNNLSYDVSSYASVYFQINSTYDGQPSGFMNIAIS